MGAVLERMERRAVLLDRQTRAHDLDYLLELERGRWKESAQRIRASGDPTGSFLSGTNVELIYASIATGTAKGTFTSEVQINDTAGMGAQAHLPSDFWLPNPTSVGRGIRIVARGILSSTGTPTYTFTVRFGAAGNTTSAIVLGSAALTTGSGVSNQMFELEGDIILTALGAAGTNSTVRGIGMVACGGLASPFQYPVWGGAASPGTVATVDTTIVNYINFNVACSASSASNTITLQQLLIFGLN